MYFETQQLEDHVTGMSKLHNDPEIRIIGGVGDNKIPVSTNIPSTLEDDFLKGGGFCNLLCSEVDLCKPDSFCITMPTSILIEPTPILNPSLVKWSIQVVWQSNTFGLVLKYAENMSGCNTLVHFR